MSKTEQAVASVSDLKTHAGFWLRFVSNHVSHAFARKLLSSGVTVAEWVILREMYDHADMSPSVLAVRTGLTRGAVSKLIDRLLAKKLVTRHESTADRRFQDIALNDASRHLVPTLANLADANDEEFFHPLTAQERATLIATLKKLVQVHGFHIIPTK